jgi:hypothetical protein
MGAPQPERGEHYPQCWRSHADCARARIVELEAQRLAVDREIDLVRGALKFLVSSEPLKMKKG